jgi:ankyrin repeat protein
MGHYDSVKILLQNGAHPELVDSDGMSALHKCAEKGHYSCAELILNTDPDKCSELVKLRNNKNDTVYDILVARNDENLEKWAELLSK